MIECASTETCHAIADQLKSLTMTAVFATSALISLWNLIALRDDLKRLVCRLLGP